MLDSCDDESTKSHEHLRQNFVPQSTFVKTDRSTSLPFTQDCYLSCIESNTEFNKFISTFLRQFEVSNCSGGGDSSIVEKSLIMLLFERSSKCDC